MLKPGKQFEQDFQKSIPFDTYWYRLRDCPSGWTAGEPTSMSPPGAKPLRRFTPRNGYDLFLFGNNTLFTLELKTTKGPRFPLSNMSDLQETELARSHGYAGVVSGLVVNYRELERTFFLPITAVWAVRLEGVKSINIAAAEAYGVEIPQRKKLVHYRYDVEHMMRYAIAQR